MLLIEYMRALLASAYLHTDKIVLALGLGLLFAYVTFRATHRRAVACAESWMLGVCAGLLGVLAAILVARLSPGATSVMPARVDLFVALVCAAVAALFFALHLNQQEEHVPRCPIAWFLLLALFALGSVSRMYVYQLIAKIVQLLRPPMQVVSVQSPTTGQS